MIEALLHGLFMGLVCSVFRFADGADKITRGVVFGMIGTVYMVATPQIHEQWVSFAVATALISAGLSWGWGKWFSAITGKYYTHEREFVPIGWLLDPWGERYPYLAGVIGMSLRWLVFFTPLYVYLNWAIDKPIYHLGILVFIGPLYWIAGKIWGNTYKAFTMAEIYTGFLYGFSLGI
ncbi:hypothetical protein LCGC14_1833820 [marine sediment metagenome]|uniref:Uncharacterized protein n=1 Tax=marine sediment metagenome TaxID=412755 RepID=A0A0F9H3H4_9ZZZZ